MYAGAHAPRWVRVLSGGLAGAEAEPCGGRAGAADRKTAIQITSCITTACCLLAPHPVTAQCEPNCAEPLLCHRGRAHALCAFMRNSPASASSSPSPRRSPAARRTRRGKGRAAWRRDRASITAAPQPWWSTQPPGLA